MSDASSTYDEVPYTSFPYALTHPDRLATVGRLFGMQPPDIASARILELGCAAGGNLIPMAEQLPGAELIGVDLSSRQVADGTATIAELALSNVELRHADLTTIDSGWGTFDYVLCHGVYSWVPPDVQARILEICRDRLAPQGIAYVSYNTYPGWHMRESIRHMMRFHVEQFSDAGQQTEQAAALVDFLASTVAENDFYGQLLRRELDVLSRTSSAYLFHEHLEEHNHPLYFHQFAERAADRGLQYLGEANVHTMFDRELGPEVAETLGRISSDIIALEQYMDFVRNRQFRQTLLCKSDVELQRNLGPDLIAQFHVGFSAVPPDEPLNLEHDVLQTFDVDSEYQVSSALPVTKAALSTAQQRWPDTVPFAELCDTACRAVTEALGEPPDPQLAAQQLAVDLLTCFLQGTVELRSAPLSLCVQPGPCPLASTYARWEVARDNFATNRRHSRVELDDETRHVLGLLDGRHDHEAITDALVAMVEDGTLGVTREGHAVGDGASARAAIAQLVEQKVEVLRQLALVIA